jgi:hypothetical protein
VSAAFDNELPLGWVDFHDRTDEQNAVHSAIVGRMPSFTLFGDTPPVGTKILLTNTWTDKRVVDSLGFAFPGWHQYTGSCVGVGGGNAAQTVNFLDAILRVESEKIVLLLWLYNYGRSRELGGMRGRGEGSFGSTFAQSLAEDGATEWDVEGVQLPSTKINGQIEVGASVEMQWSDGTFAPAPVRDEAKQHKIISAPLSSGLAVRDAIINGYPVTRAFNSFVNPNSATVRNGALIGTYNGRGGHQESWLGYWNHPQEGELIYEMNQWGANVYGVDPGGGAPGGCWIRIADVDKMCRSQYAEIYALSQYDGYPEQPKVFDWATQSFWS